MADPFPVVTVGGGGGGSFDGVHNDLSGRSTAGAHPISAITGLTEALAESGGEGVVAGYTAIYTGDDPVDIADAFPFTEMSPPPGGGVGSFPTLWLGDNATDPGYYLWDVDTSEWVTADINPTIFYAGAVFVNDTVPFSVMSPSLAGSMYVPYNGDYTLIGQLPNSAMGAYGAIWSTNGWTPVMTQVDYAIADNGTGNIDLEAPFSADYEGLLIFGRDNAAENGLYNAYDDAPWERVDPQPVWVVADVILDAGSLENVYPWGEARTMLAIRDGDWAVVGMMPGVTGNPSEVFTPSGWQSPASTTVYLWDGDEYVVANGAVHLSTSARKFVGPNDPDGEGFTMTDGDEWVEAGA